jgi:hypothetical protein
VTKFGKSNAMLAATYKLREVASHPAIHAYRRG